jgi:protein-L-isoaspartate(D-aspartate) O-methyltransferase
MYEKFYICECKKSPVLSTCGFSIFCEQSTILKDTYKHKGLRKRLVEDLISKGIRHEKVLQAILHVPRHFFFDRNFEDFSYEDKAYPIGEGQTISQPYTVAVQTALIDPQKGEKILEIGTGSGYQSAILSFMQAQLYSVERKKNLIDSAAKALGHLNLQATLVYADGTLGLPVHAPYDKIIVTAGAPDIPRIYLEQLKTNGVLVIPVGDNEKQRMLRVVKTAADETEISDHGPFRFVPLIGEQGW